MRLMLFSNSTMAGEPYLDWTRPYLAPFLAGIIDALFVPYAAVDRSFDEYTAQVAAGMDGVCVTGIHTLDDKARALAAAQAIVVGGGNTFSLLRHCQDLGILPLIRDAVQGGARYVGWSAGANLACPTIKTTNDMPIETTDGLDALGLVPFQINPHFTTETLVGHGGESRLQRINEFRIRNPWATVVGLPEGMLIEVEGESMTLRGSGTALWFAPGDAPVSIPAGPLPGR